jgi:hypothetical protein
MVLGMDDEQKLSRQRELGIQAKQLLDSELLTAIFEGLKNSYIKGWAQSDKNDSKTREEQYFLLRALMDVREEMKIICQNGETAEKFLESKRQQAA